ncbi:response regulator transcription factor [Ralstonia sp. A12]|uniref:response regulator transcription factor n=1 Tax=Ralstonia sp. A12 TaxID=1217052 RepID=UPI001E39BF59|nr:helix-turn-helix transcriptional regulator [Ralstonia sp. A12]
MLEVSLFDGRNDLVSHSGSHLFSLEELHAMLGRVLGCFPQTAAEPLPATMLPTDFSTLTPRQLDVVREIARGASNAEIAAALHISVETVKAHIGRILSQLGARNRTAIAAMYWSALSDEHAPE